MERLGHRFEIELDQTGRDSKVSMDGKELSGVRGIDIRTSMDGPTTVRLELLAAEVLGSVEAADVMEFRKR